MTNRGHRAEAASIADRGPEKEKRNKFSTISPNEINKIVQYFTVDRKMTAP